jgi:exosortase E/protease (VPEID-CTERM system)
VYLAAHLTAFAVLVSLTGAVWEGPLGRSPGAGVWVAAWLATGLVTLAFWLAAVRPAGAWPGLARRSFGVFLAALAVGAAACSAGRVTGALLAPLNAATLVSVRAALAVLVGGAVYRPGEGVVGTEAFHVEVAPECSGFEGIGLIWVFLGAYLWFFRRSLRFPEALWLLPVGTVVIWLANVARIVALVVIGDRFSPAVALGGFHSQAGWLAFNAVALGLVVVSRRARLFAAGAGGPGSGSDAAVTAASGNPTAAYLGPLLALVASVMVTGALSAGLGFDALYPARVVAVAAALWVFRRGYAGLRWAWSWPAVAVGAVVFAVWMALEPAQAADSGGSAASGVAEGLARLPRALAGLWLLARVVGSVVTVPIAEELAFRGYLIRRLIAADFTAVAPGRFTWLSFVVSSCLFGGLHGRWLAGAIAGALYALALYRKGELSEAVLAHATTNALIAIYVLSTGAWSLWV